MISTCYLIEPFTCKENESVSEIAKKLKQFGQRQIYVVDESQKPVGIVSITDLMDKIVIEQKDPSKMVAKDVMNKDVIVFDDSDDVKKAYKAMTERGVVTCAVVQGQKMVGMLSLKEALKCVTDPKNFG